MSDSLQPHGLQHTRLPCPSPTPGACSNSCPLSGWCHPIISSHPLSSPSPPTLNLSQHQGLFQWASSSASASVLPMNIQDWFPLRLTGWISLQSKRLSRVFSNTTVQKHQFLVLSFLYSPTLTSIHDYWKNHSSDWTVFCRQSNSLLFNMLSRLLIAFLARSKHLSISWLQSPFAVIWEPKKIKSVTVSIVSPSTCHEVMGPDAMILVFWMLYFKPAFSLSSFTFIKRLFSSSSLSAIRVVSSAYLRLLIFLPQSWFQLLFHPAWHFTWCTLHIS